ncbi:adenosine receptor A2a-like [Oculina patagonica]
MFEPSAGEQIARDAFIYILMFFILVGNSLIIAAYVKNSRLRTGSNVFIVGLAASDWLVGAFAVPLYVVTLRRENSSPMLSRFFISLDIFSGTASVFHLVSVTVERYIAIAKPFLHRGLLLNSYYGVLGVVWVLSLILSCLDFTLTPSTNRNYPFYVLLAVFSLALLSISLLNGLIFKIARSLIHNTVEPAVEMSQTRASLQRKIRRERRTAATLAMMSGVFFVTWCPHVIGAFVFTFQCFPCNLSLVDIGRIGAFIKCMQYSNSALNPFVFAFRDVEMRMTVKTLTRAWWNVVQPHMPSSRVTATSTLALAQTG